MTTASPRLHRRHVLLATAAAAALRAARCASWSAFHPVAAPMPSPG
jgi:hypothetical protein